MKEDNPEQEVIFLHCIIHQEALCKSVLQLHHVVKPVVKLVNLNRARGLQHHQFIKFPEETDADHQDLLYHSIVRWLSLGKVCQRVWELKQEIISFLELLEKVDDFPELSDTDWLCDFAFAVDILIHMNELNVKPQGKDQFVHEMYTNVRAFKTKPKPNPSTCEKNTGNHWTTCIKNSDVGSLILTKLTSHFSWCHVPSHKTLKRHHRSCSWN